MWHVPFSSFATQSCFGGLSLARLLGSIMLKIDEVVSLLLSVAVVKGVLPAPKA